MPYIAIIIKQGAHSIPVVNDRYVTRVPIVGEFISYDDEKGVTHECRVERVLHNSAGRAEFYEEDPEADQPPPAAAMVHAVLEDFDV